MRDEIPGLPGIQGMVVSTLGAALAITLATGVVVHWVPVALAIVVGLKAVQIINRR